MKKALLITHTQTLKPHVFHDKCVHSSTCMESDRVAIAWILGLILASILLLTENSDFQDSENKVSKQTFVSSELKSDSKHTKNKTTEAQILETELSLSPKTQIYFNQSEKFITNLINAHVANTKQEIQAGFQ